jgi:hypothetical protein
MCAQLTREVKIAVWTRFDMHGLEVAPSLAGAEHRFEFRGRTVSFRLPKRPKVKDWQKKNASITCSSYRVRSTRKVPVRYSIHGIDALLRTRKKRSIRQDAFERVDVSLFSRRQRTSLDKICASQFQILTDAFDYWLEVLRWKSGLRMIGQYRVNRQRSAWGPYLADSDTGRLFYASTRLISVGRPATLSVRHWKLAEKALLALRNVPVWQQYLSEAEQKLQTGDSRGAVLDAAIAVETSVRQLIATAVLRVPNASAEGLLNALPISRILDKWTQLGFSSRRWREQDLQKDLKSLFEMRNAIMHRGKRVDPEADLLYRALSAANYFVGVGEEYMDRADSGRA